MRLTDGPGRSTMAGIEAASFDEALDRVMGYYDRLCAPLRGPGNRLAVRLARYRLSWLAFPWMFVETIWGRSEEHTSELQSRFDLVCRLLLEKKIQNTHS